MNNEPLHQISRRDFGFVVARVLALVAWRSGASILVASGTMLYSSFRYRAEIGSNSFDDQMMRILPMFGFAGVIIFVGIRLWLKADRFGTTECNEDQSSNTTVSRVLLLQGLAIGAAIWMLIPAVPDLCLGLWWLLSQDQARASTHLTVRDPLSDVISAAFAVGLIVWACRSWKQTDQVQPEVFTEEP